MTKALELADRLVFFASAAARNEAATELRRLHAENEALKAQRKSLAAVITWLENGCDPLAAAKELQLIKAAHGIK